MWMVTVPGEREDFGEWPVEGAEYRGGKSIVYFLSRKVAKAFAAAYGGELAQAEWEVDLSYQQSWEARPVGERWWLRPEWDASDVPAGRIPLAMKTGLVFGGGDHPTTCAALELLERIPGVGRTVFDLGCGTGILGEAALRLGARRVVGCDLEADAVLMTKQRGVRVYQGPAFAARDGVCDLMLANLPGYVHLDLAGEYARLVQGGGQLIVSGYYDWQVARIEEALGSEFVKREQILRGDAWVGGLYTRSRA